MKYVVIGAGIIGTSISRELALRGKNEVIVLEKEVSEGLHSSGRNSGVIHSGINQKPGTLKAKLCIEGSKLLREYCKEHNVPMLECGTIIVANNEQEISRLRDLYKYALECGVPGVRIITKAELKEREPRARALEAMLSPTGAIVDSSKLVKSLVEEAKSLGVKFYFNSRVEKIKYNEVEAEKESYPFDIMINCAGLHADTLAHTNNIGGGYSIIPFRGDYVEIPAEVNGMIYHVPDLRFPFLGVHLTKTIDKKVIAGPTATLSFAGREGYSGGLNHKLFTETANSINFWKWAAKALTDKGTRKQVFHNLAISVSERRFLHDVYEIYEGEIQSTNLRHYRSGIRPQIVDEHGNLITDFLVEKSGNQIHILNAVSPGLTASLAFAKYIIDNYVK